ncbi:MAG: alpha/beta fold hydrolase [Elusimicrobia bacterium]|nr:alpha/beta fold hydrolase [Elusimicrobiota bacterium]
MRSFTARTWPLALAAVLCACTNVFLQPTRAVYLSPDRVGAKWSLVHFRAPGGPELAGFWFPSDRGPAKGVVVQFHGNGENMTSHFLYVYWLALEGWDVLAFDYRGYGLSAGSKSLSGAVADGAAALAEARRLAPGLPLAVIGQSLGGALAVASLDRDGGAGLRALVLDSTFSSYRGIAREKLRLSRLTRPLAWPLGFLISDRFSPDRLIARRRPVPLLFLHAKDDPIVPYADGRRLYELAPGPKEFWDVPGNVHTAALGPLGATFRPRVLRFLDDSLLK